MRAQVEVKPSYGLSDTARLRPCFKESMNHARDDLWDATQAARGAGGGAAGTLEALRAALAQLMGNALLDATEERRRVDRSLLGRVLRKGRWRRRIRRPSPRPLAQTLEQTCGFYVERRMNRSIHDAMAGHKVEEF